jgi:hypothetical protein
MHAVSLQVLKGVELPNTFQTLRLSLPAGERFFQADANKDVAAFVPQCSGRAAGLDKTSTTGHCSINMRHLTTKFAKLGAQKNNMA